MKSDRSLKVLLAPAIEENVELSADEGVRFTTAVSLRKSQQYSERFEQLNIIWLLLSESKLESSFTSSNSQQIVRNSKANRHQSK